MLMDVHRPVQVTNTVQAIMLQDEPRDLVWNILG